MLYSFNAEFSVISISSELFAVIRLVVIGKRTVEMWYVKNW